MDEAEALTLDDGTYLTGPEVALFRALADMVIADGRPPRQLSLHVDQESMSVAKLLAEHGLIRGGGMGWHHHGNILLTEKGAWLILNHPCFR